MEEPEKIDEFLDVLLANFQAASAVNFAALHAFKHDPRESLHMLGTRFNIIAPALEGNNLMSSRSLALSLLQHLPDMIRLKVEAKMRIQDAKRLKRDEPLTDREDLMTMARQEEYLVLKLEDEYRVAGMTPKPRTGAYKLDNPRSPIQDRLKYPSGMADRLGARVVPCSEAISHTGHGYTRVSLLP